MTGEAQAGSSAFQRNTQVSETHKQSTWALTSRILAGFCMTGEAGFCMTGARGRILHDRRGRNYTLLLSREIYSRIL